MSHYFLFVIYGVVGDGGWENKLNKIMVKIKRANKTVVTISQFEHFSLAVTLYQTCHARHCHAEGQVNIPCLLLKIPWLLSFKSFICLQYP